MREAQVVNMHIADEATDDNAAGNMSGNNTFSPPIDLVL